MKEYKRLTETLTIGGKTGYILNCSNCDKKAQCKNDKNYKNICLRVTIDRLAELEDKIENGTLVELPRIIHPNKAEWYVQYQYPSGIIQYDICFSESEAEAKLKELKGKI